MRVFGLRCLNPRVASEAHDDLSVINLRMLIELKHATRRSQDFVDVVKLARANNLDDCSSPSFMPAVKSNLIECLEEKRREDEYDRRQRGAN